MVNWLLLDLNSYFASVEQQKNPKLRGRPVAVVPMIAENTCCIAASYEAKAFGIKTGTLVKDARKMCPGIIFINGNHEDYIKTHHQIVQVVEKCLPISAVLSIDEMACKLMGAEKQVENAVRIAQKMKHAIHKEVGECLTSSIGLAPNKFLAKVASDRQKPDGLTIIRKEDLPSKLIPLKLRDMPGIGAAMEQRLNRYGVHTMEQLLALTRDHMRFVWGSVNGERMWDWLRGDEWDFPETETKSIGHSHVLPPELRTREGAWMVAQKLLHKAAARLRKAEFWASGLYLSVRFLDQEEKYKNHISMMECQDDITLKENLDLLWKGIPKSHAYERPFKISITLCDFVPDACHNFSLFQKPRRENLSQAMDNINARFGRNSIYFSSLQKAEAAAPTRIAFTNIPALEM